jgi:hypothetical protein
MVDSACTTLYKPQKLHFRAKNGQICKMKLVTGCWGLCSSVLLGRQHLGMQHLGTGLIHGAASAPFCTGSMLKTSKTAIKSNITPVKSTDFLSSIVQLI